MHLLSQKKLKYNPYLPSSSTFFAILAYSCYDSGFAHGTPDSDVRKVEHCSQKCGARKTDVYRLGTYLRRYGGGVRVGFRIPCLDFGQKSVLLTNTQNSIQVQDDIEPPFDHPRWRWDTLYLITIHTCYMFRTMDRLLQTTLEGFSSLRWKAKRGKGLCDEHHMH